MFLFLMLWEIGWFVIDVVFGEVEYLFGCIYNGCGEGVFVLIDIVVGYEVFVVFYVDEEIECLCKLFGLILCLCNDIFLYLKEVGELSSNFVCVLMYECGFVL